MRKNNYYKKEVLFTAFHCTSRECCMLNFTLHYRRIENKFFLLFFTFQGYSFTSDEVLIGRNALCGGFLTVGKSKTISLNVLKCQICNTVEVLVLRLRFYCVYLCISCVFFWKPCCFDQSTIRHMLHRIPRQMEAVIQARVANIRY